MKKKILWILPVLCAAMLLALPALADEVTVTYDLEYRYDLAQTVYTLTNDLRTGDNAWYWDEDDAEQIDVTGIEGLVYDYGLEKAAMERAAEIAIFYSHTRPDGSSCFTVRSGISGENIAWGYGSAQAVVEAWWEENEKYAGQGHRRNILSSDNLTIGVGCVYADGLYYWVQEFSWEPSGEGQQKFSGPRTIAVDPSKITDKNNKPGELALSDLFLIIDQGAAADVPVVTIPLGRGGTRVTIKDPAWVSSDAAVAQVSGGKVTGKALGAASITCSAFGQTVEVPITVLSWPTAVTAPGGVLDLGTLDGFDVSRASGWSGAAVKGNFLIADQEGIVTVTYKYAFPGDIVRDLAFDVTVTKASIKDCVVEVDAEDLTYTGEALEPQVKVTRTVGDTTLTLLEGTDYTLDYADNVNAGTAKVTVTGAGHYTGVKAVPFKIGARALKSNVKLTMAKISIPYTGRELKPVVTVRDTVNGKTVTLKKDTDYTVTYSNNKNAGKATVTVTGKGNYTGKATMNFTITRVKLSSVTLQYTKKAYTGKALQPTVTVKAKVNGKTVTLKKSRDYTVTYKNNKNAGQATVTVKGKGNFTGTIKKTFTITKVKLKSAELKNSSFTYTGNALKPAVTVKAKVNGKTVTLKKGTDYTVTYKDNINRGTATVTIKGKGNYTGTITKTFKIK